MVWVDWFSLGIAIDTFVVRNRFGHSIARTTRFCCTYNSGFSFQLRKNHMSPTLPMNSHKTWIVRYLAVIVIGVALASLLGRMELFQVTALLRGKLTAAQMIRFAGYATALYATWMLGQCLARMMHAKRHHWVFLRHLVLPVFTLMVVAASHRVALIVLRPFLSTNLNELYNWLFIIAITACAVWIILAVLGQTETLTSALSQRKDPPPAPANCRQCGASNAAEARFCTQCGQTLAPPG